METSLGPKKYPQQILGIIALGFLAVVYVFLYVDRAEKRSLLQRAETVAAALPREEVALLPGRPEDIESIPYQSVKRKLERITAVNPDVRFVYLTALRGPDIVFLVDSEEPGSGDFSPPGQIYPDASEKFVASFGTGESFVEGPLSDEYGVWISALTPIVSTSTGEVLAIVGVDVPARAYYARIGVVSLVPVLATLLLVYYAVSSRRLARKEQENIDLRSEFIAVASHDLRSPITGIKWALQSLTDTRSALDPVHKKALSRVLATVERLLSSINDLLEFAALEKGIADRPGKKAHNLYGIIKGAIENLEFAAREKEISVELSGEWPTMGDEVLADKNRLTMAFANIVSNGIKYSPKGGKVVLSREAAGPDITITVRDGGIGIPKEEQQSIFKEFFRSSNAVRDVPAGTGLGLYYTKAIIESHGGKIWFESEEGSGTTFHIRVPRA